jgi:hypothetical protein
MGSFCRGSPMVVGRAGVPGIHVSMMAVAGALSLGCGNSSIPNPGNDAATTNAASCPSSYTEAEATGPCETNGEQCYYATGNCICSILSGGPATDAAPPTTPSWGCISLAPGCPAFPPHDRNVVHRLVRALHGRLRKIPRRLCRHNLQLRRVYPGRAAVHRGDLAVGGKYRVSALR